MYRIGQEEINELARLIETKKLFKTESVLKESRQVEEKLGKLFDTKYPIFMTSGHAGLVSALVGMGIGPGDEVIVPAYTYIATAMAVVAVGAMPVIVEVNETLTIDPEDIKRNITPHTKAIIPVHIQGFPCDMKSIMEIAREHNLFVLEDACQADGGHFQGKRLGTIGDAGALSFNYYKIVSSGEGGALLTDDREIYERALIYHDSSAVAFFGDQLNGFSTKEFCGHEFRSNELCAAVMSIQLDRLDSILKSLRDSKKYIMDSLKGIAKFAPSNDIEGDCGTTLAFQFDTAEEAERFAQSIGGTVPINTGKHVYRNWTAIMEKRGAFNPLMDPFKMEANRDIVPDYTSDMCPKTMDYLSKVVYVGTGCDHTRESLEKKLADIKKALGK